MKGISGVNVSTRGWTGGRRTSKTCDSGLVEGQLEPVRKTQMMEAGTLK